MSDPSTEGATETTGSGGPLPLPPGVTYTTIPAEPGWRAVLRDRPSHRDGQSPRPDWDAPVIAWVIADQANRDVDPDDGLDYELLESDAVVLDVGPYEARLCRLRDLDGVYDDAWDVVRYTHPVHAPLTSDEEAAQDAALDAYEADIRDRAATGSTGR